MIEGNRQHLPLGSVDTMGTLGRNRVKPDPETNPLALLDWKELATLG
jgi:hypothetical protein